MIQSDRGSMWRKWDLQIHTPHSHLNNSFGNDFRAYFTNLLIKAEQAKIAAVGLTDYFTIEGYKEAVALLSDQPFLDSLPDEKTRTYAKRLLVLPNVELRTNFLIQDKTGKDSRVNMHVIFSNEVSSAEIEEHFFREVKFWAEAEPQKTAEQRSLTVANLTDLGKKLKSQHARFASHSDVYVGMMNAVIDAHEVAKVLANHPSKFEHKYLICFPCDEDLSTVSWDGQGHLSRKQYVQMADVMFSSNENTRKFGLGKFHDSPEDYLQEFKSFKPCLHSSDAHTYDELFEPFEGRFTWIKSDVTFEGLRQVLHEPEHRVFVGDTPEQLSLVRSNPTRYINQVSVTKNDSSTNGEKWFDTFDIRLSPELVAIIGKKGSGKSALSDIIGFLGNSNQFEHFSFLTPKRFWNDGRRRAKAFGAKLVWHDKNEQVRKLSEERQLGQPETVKYIPQNYLELICNEIEQGSDSSFQKELQEVIFSHIEPAMRRGSTSLLELIRSKNSAIEERLTLLKSQIRGLTDRVVSLEAQGTASERSRISSLLEEKKREIAAHEEIKPKDEVVDAAQEREALSTAQKELAEVEAKLQEAEKVLSTYVADRIKLIALVGDCDGLLASLANLELGFRPLYERVDERASKLGISTAEIVKLTIKRDGIEAKKKEAGDATKALDLKIDEQREDSQGRLVLTLRQGVEAVKKKLTEPERRRQMAQQAKAAWEKKLAELTGSTEVPGSLKHLEGRLRAFESVPKQIDDLKNEREEVLLQVYDCISDLAGEYRSLFEPVKKFFDAHSAMYPEVSIEFIVKQRIRGFTASFLAYIDQSKKGHFRGTEEGQKAANALVGQADLQSREGVRTFLRSVESKLGSGTDIEEQLVKGRSRKELLDFLYDLDYIRPRFDLLWDGKAPEQLSPGERGSLLLVFYLVLDMRRCPLVIDQPEENLDNETIFKILVPCIMFAKRRRQVVMVTHNPNLAVAADADQIIYASVNKNPTLELKYETGAIENPKMTTHIINVLEGTKPAFKKREARYDGA